MTRVEYVLARLPKEEGTEPYAYNDATGKRVTCRPNGNLSIARGINLEFGLDATEMDFLDQHRVGLTDAQLRKYAWYTALDEPRGSVFLDLGYNDGVTGLLHFTDTIHFAALGEWQPCAAALLDSVAAKKLPSRYGPLAQILSTGVIA